MKKTTNLTLNFRLEAMFLHQVNLELDEIGRKQDLSREWLSSSINTVFNGAWGKKNKDIERGAIIGVLKHGETALNDSLVRLAKLQHLMKSRMNELYACSDKEESKRRSK